LSAQLGLKQPHKTATNPKTEEESKEDVEDDGDDWSQVKEKTDDKRKPSNTSSAYT